MSKLNLIGQKFNRLFVVKEYKKDSKGRITWECLCDCGNISYVSSDNLRRNHTKSCGCLQKEITSISSKTHGESHNKLRTAEYRSWSHMKTRCYNPKCDMYYTYGGRGIIVCDKWLNSFEAFLSDMGRRPTTKHSLDRIDVNGNYEPNNCRWATITQQLNNKTNNRLIEYRGQIKTISEWAKIFNTTDNVIRRRINRGVAFEENHKKKTVLDLQTGIFYDSSLEASIAKSINVSTLRNKLSGRINNNISMIYV